MGKLLEKVGLFISLIYIFLRPFLNTYFTEYIKFIFVITVVLINLKFFLSVKRINKNGRIIILLCLFWAYAIISSLLNGGIELFVYTIERYVFYNTVFFTGIYLADKINWDFLAKFLVVYGVIDSAVASVEFFTKKQMFAIGGKLHNVAQLYGDDSIRTFGLNGDYFLLAETLCVCAFFALYLYIVNKKKIYGVSFLIIVFGIFCSGSRGYYVAFLCGLSLFFLLLNFEKGITKKGLMIFSFAVFGVFFGIFLLFFTNIHTGIYSIDTFIDRFRSVTDFDSNYSNVARANLWLRAINSWMSNFWFGNGASCTDLRYSGFTSVTESGLLKRLVELGFIGTVLQYLTMFYPLVKGIKKYKSNQSFKKIILFCFCIVLTFFVEDMILQRYGEIEFSVVIWFAISVIYSSPITEKKIRNTCN